MTTQKTPHRWADVLRAIADGDEVQYRYTDKDTWKTWESKTEFSPVWCAVAYEWRIAPKKQTVWVNVYQGWISNQYKTKQEADSDSSRIRIACIPITFTEGEGL